MLRLRGGPGPSEGGGEAAADDERAGEEKFESLDALAMAGLSEHVVYRVSAPISLAAGQAASVPIGTFALRGERVLVFDPKVSQTCASRCVHLTNT